MSSIVSRRPSSRNQWNEAFWMSIRLGRSRTCLRREKLQRALGAATLVVNEIQPPPREVAGMRTGEDGGTSAQPARLAKEGSSPQADPCGRPPSVPGL